MLRVIKLTQSRNSRVHNARGGDFAGIGARTLPIEFLLCEPLLLLTELGGGGLVELLVSTTVGILASDCCCDCDGDDCDCGFEGAETWFVDTNVVEACCRGVALGNAGLSEVVLVLGATLRRVVEV